MVDPSATPTRDLRFCQGPGASVTSIEFGTLALITAAGLLGPLLAVRKEWRVPIVLGELVAGVALGHTGMQILDPSEPTFGFLADIGFDHGAVRTDCAPSRRQWVSRSCWRGS